MPATIEHLTGQTWTVTVGNATALIEVLDDSTVVFGPLADTAPVVVVGVEHYAALIRDDRNGEVRDAPGYFTTLDDGTLGNRDMVGDAGREVAAAALVAWDADGQTPDRVKVAKGAAAAARTAVLRQVERSLLERAAATNAELASVRAELAALAAVAAPDGTSRR